MEHRAGTEQRKQNKKRTSRTREPAKGREKTQKNTHQGAETIVRSAENKQKKPKK